MCRLFLMINLYALLLFSLLGCPGKKRGSGEAPLLQPTSESLVVLNALDRNFTLINRPNSEAPVFGPQPMGGMAKVADVECGGPSHVVAFHEWLYVICFEQQEIHVFDQANFRLKKVIYLGDKVGPSGLLIDQAGRGFVPSAYKNEILSFSALFEVKATNVTSMGSFGQGSLSGHHIPTPGGLIKINNRLYVAMANLGKAGVAGGPGYIVVIDTDRGEKIESIPLKGRNTASLYRWGKSSILAVSRGDLLGGDSPYLGNGMLEEIDLESHKILRSVELDGAPGRMVVSNKDVAYFTNGNSGIILSVDLIDFKVLNPIDLSGPLCGRARKTSQLSYISAVLFRGGRVFATEFNSDCLVIINAKNKEILFEIPTGKGPVDLSFLSF